MSFAVTGPLYLYLEDETGGYLGERVPVTSWAEEEGAWRGSAVTFPQVYGAVGYCIVDEQGMKVAPAVRFAEGAVYGNQGDDLTVWPSIEFVKEYV